MTDSQTAQEPVAAGGAAPENLRTLTMVVYGLQAGSFLIGLSAIVAVVINYVKKDEVAGTWLESHFRWQIRTFWFGLLWAVIAFATQIFLIGGLVLFADVVWIIYRIIKGWLDLVDRKPMYPGQTS